MSRDLSTFSLRDLADMVGVESQMPGVSDYLQTFDWFPNVASRLLSIDQHVEVEFDVPVSAIFYVAEVDENHYPDEGEGLEALREELGTISSADLAPQETGTTEVTLSALDAFEGDSDLQSDSKTDGQDDQSSGSLDDSDQSPRHA